MSVSSCFRVLALAFGLVGSAAVAQIAAPDQPGVTPQDTTAAHVLADTARHGVSQLVLDTAKAYDDAHHTATLATGHGEGHGEKLNVANLMFGHVMDSHEWHITDWPSGNGHYTPIALHLPFIIWNSEKGIDVFSLHGHTLAEKQADAATHGYTIDQFEQIKPLAAGVTAIDISITKNVLQMIIVAILLVVVMTSLARAYTARKGQAPKGLQSLLEPIIIFVRDEIAKPNMHGKHDKYMPYLLTLFFFIWFSNLLGLTPLNSNIAGNISFTAALAILTFFITQFSGTKDYWGHVFWFPGVPVPMKFLIAVIEFIGLFTKPFSLMVRLFANILAGHFMILALISLIFILYGSFGFGGAAGIAPLSVAFSLLIMCIEMLVAIIQAYVFTLLTSIFVGQALETHAHEHDHHHEQHDVQTVEIHNHHTTAKAAH